MLRIRKRLGGMAAYGRWVALLGMLYDEGGILDMGDKEMRDIVADELELEDVDEFFTELAKVGLIDKELYSSMGHVVNNGVCSEIEYRKQRKEIGRKASEARWRKERK